jgi:hypothetical protein
LQDYAQRVLNNGALNLRRLEMKKRVTLLAACILLISVSLAQALPTYQILDPGGRTTSGGPFRIVGNSMDFQSYCVETAEYISIGGTYWGSIDNLVYYSSGSQTFSAPIYSGTAKLYNYFLDNQLTLTNVQKGDIQGAIWAFQGQAGGSTNWWYNNAGTLVASNRTVWALNLWTVDVGGSPYNNAGDFAHRAQSMLIAGDIPYNTPEPGVLILLGLGLIGVVGIKRKFKM